MLYRTTLREDDDGDVDPDDGNEAINKMKLKNNVVQQWKKYYNGEINGGMEKKKKRCGQMRGWTDLGRER